MQNCSRWDLWIIVGRSFWKHTELTLFLMLWAPRKISETRNVFGWTREAFSDRSSQLSLFLCHLFIHPRFPHWPFLTTSVYLSLTSVCHEDPAINVATCTSLWTRISETVAVDGSLAWLPPHSLSLSLCGWPQASSRAAVLPPPHEEQTQTTAAGLLTWHPAGPRHARGICSAHARKYSRPARLTQTQTHVHYDL